MSFISSVLCKIFRRGRLYFMRKLNHQRTESNLISPPTLRTTSTLWNSQLLSSFCPQPELSSPTKLLYHLPTPPLQPLPHNTSTQFFLPMPPTTDILPKLSDALPSPITTLSLPVSVKPTSPLSGPFLCRAPNQLRKKTTIKDKTETVFPFSPSLCIFGEREIFVGCVY